MIWFIQLCDMVYEVCDMSQSKSNQSLTIFSLISNQIPLVKLEIGHRIAIWFIHLQHCLKNTLCPIYRVSVLCIEHDVFLSQSHRCMNYIAISSNLL